MNEFLPLINIAGLVALGSSMVFIQWRTGSYNEYKVQVQQLREELATEKKGREDDKHSLKNEIQALALQLEHMKGADSEKDKKIKEFTDIFQGKDPQQIQYMSDMRDFTKGVAQYMKDSAEIFAGMKVFMTKLNDQSNNNQARNDIIDKKGGD